MLGNSTRRTRLRRRRGEARILERVCRHGGSYRAVGGARDRRSAQRAKQLLLAVALSGVVRSNQEGRTLGQER